MKKIKKIISIFYPIDKLKNCNIANKQEKLANFLHNKSQKWAVYDCAINWFYAFAFLMFMVDCFGHNKFNTTVDSFKFAICVLSAVSASLCATAGIFLIVVFIFLCKLEPSE